MSATVKTFHKDEYSYTMCIVLLHVAFCEEVHSCCFFVFQTATDIFSFEIFCLFVF